MGFASTLDHLDGDEVDFRDLILPRPHVSVLFRAPDQRFASEGILAGDHVVIERAQPLRDGGYALVSVNGEPRLVRVLRNHSRFTFGGAPSDADAQVEVLGVVSRVVRLLLPPFHP
jgi:SOS-response transcriptional repressor LexA